MKNLKNNIKSLLVFLLSLTLLLSFTACGDETFEFSSPLDDLTDGSTSLIFVDDDRYEDDDSSPTVSDRYQTDHEDQIESPQDANNTTSSNNNNTTTTSSNNNSSNNNNTNVNSVVSNNNNTTNGGVGTGVATPVKLSEIPAYSGKPYVVINNNIPNFSKSELTTIGYEKYSNLDYLGRCGKAVASIGKETMPTKDRTGSLTYNPTGWIQASYDCIPNGYLYNRAHLIGWQLSDEMNNSKNLMTGTKYLNNSGMLPFENMIADYIKEIKKHKNLDYHVAYRVTPIYDGNNLLASGVQMEAYSIEDEGDGICFNVFIYNVQPGITINYKTGSSYETNPSSNKPIINDNTPCYITRTGSKYHSSKSCSGLIKAKAIYDSTVGEAKSKNLTPCSKCY